MIYIQILQTGLGDRFHLRRTKNGPIRLMVKNGQSYEFRAIGKVQKCPEGWTVQPQFWKCPSLIAATSVHVALLAVEEFLKEPRELRFRERRDHWTSLQLRGRK